MRRGSVGVVIGTAAALMLGAGLVSAQPWPAPEEAGPGPMHGAARFLQLSDEQAALVGQVLEQQRPQMNALREQIRRNRTLLREALDSPAPDAQIVGELVIEGESLRKRGEVLREQTEKAIEGFLTPEQKRRREMLEAARAVSGPARGPRGLRMGPGGLGLGPRDGAGPDLH